MLRRTIRFIKASPAGAALVRLMPMSWKGAMGRLLARRKVPLSRQILAQVGQQNDLLAHLVYQQAKASSRFQDPLRLLGSGYKIYSQHDEDGIIDEIFRRIGCRDRFFVEFGVGDGIENCTLYCVLKGWRGVWIDGSAQCYQGVLAHMKEPIESRRLSVKYAFINAENIEHLFAEMHVPQEFDLLSIDIDRNDYWVWRAIQRYRPRVVAIEYNASLGPVVPAVVPYDPFATWDGCSNYYGASLKALELLGEEKGYLLVGCNYTGVTAFFVRHDLVGDRFLHPFTAENHYEPPRYFVRMPNGHRPAFGDYKIVSAPSASVLGMPNGEHSIGASPRSPSSAGR